MNYINTSLNWEEVFFREALELEEKMVLINFEDLKKSRLRLSFENEILNWDRYSLWYTSHLGCKSLQSRLSDEQLSKIIDQARLAYEAYSHIKIWSEDLIPAILWQQKLVVFGLEYSERLIELENVIFILADVKTLNHIHMKLISYGHRLEQSDFSSSPTLSESMTSSNSLDSHLTGLDLNAKATHIDFNSLSKKPTVAETPITAEDNTIWEYLAERHEEYSFEAKKLFNGYAVLKIVSGRTQVYKMDVELENHLNGQIAGQLTGHLALDFDVNNQKNPFSKVYMSTVSESFNLNQLPDLASKLPFKYVCITALKRGKTVVGFLVGFKSDRLAESDQTLLEDLAKESA